MDNLEKTKTIVEVIKMCGEAFAILAGATGISAAAASLYFWQQNQRIEAMKTAWKETADLLEKLKRPGSPLSDYFPQYARECEKQLNIIISEAATLEQAWRDDPSRLNKYIYSQRRYVEQVQDKLKKIKTLDQGIQSSSTEAYILRARDHPLPCEGEVLRPSQAPWPNSNVNEAHIMLPADHLAYRQAQSGFALPSASTHFGAHASASQSSMDFQSPTSSSTSLLHGFGPTLPGIPPTGPNFPYLPPQGRIPGTRSSTMPVPVQFAHFNQVASTPYGHTAPTPAPPYMPYGQAAYPPSVPYNSEGSGYAPSGSRRQ